MATKRGRGRPTTFTEELALDICFRVSEGESLREICRDEKMPARSSVHKWLLENEKFSDQYAKAYDLHAADKFDEMFEIADDGSNDWMERQNEKGEVIGEMLNHEHVQRSRLRIDTRKWALARMAPKKYGDRIAVAGDEDSPIQHSVSVDITGGRIPGAK